MNNLATQNFTHLVQSAAEANVALLSARLESCDSPAAAAKLLGIDEASLDEDDDTTQAVLALTVAFRQIGSLIVSGSTLSLDPSQIEEMGANARPSVNILVSRDPERVLTDFYEHGNPEAVGRFFSRPGTAESVEADAQTIRLHYYPDGSMLAQIQSLSKPNLDLRLAMLDTARTVEEAMSAKESSELLGVLTSAADQIAKDSELPQKAADMLPALINEQALALVRALAQAAAHSVCAPIADNDALMKMLNRHAELDGLTWKSGIGVKADGMDCATPADFKSALGMIAPASLGGALERLRLARAPQSNPEAPKPPKRSR